jgi:hypothetical protein
MAILKGSSQTRFAGFLDPNAGIGQLLKRGQQAGQNFFSKAENLFRTPYIEGGTEQVPAFSFYDPSFANLKSPMRRSVITQTPKTTLFIKKRMFSTLRNNFDVRFMDEEERLFLRATKALFRRKCEEIAFYENLISLEGMLEGEGFLNIDPFLDDYIENFFNVLEIGFGLGGIFGLSKMDEVVDAIASSGPQILSDSKDIIEKLLKLREINRRSRSNKFTTWIVDHDNYDFAGIGPGTGVMELNLVSTINTTCSLKTGAGNCTVSIEDPYGLLVINEGDIEIALREAASSFGGLAEVLRAGGNLLLRQAELLDESVNLSRQLRHVNEINFEIGFNNVPAQAVIAGTGESFTAATVDNISEGQALTNIERAKSLHILTALDAYTAEQALAMQSFKVVGEDLSPLRRRMRNEFLGHGIIQHMDALHVFVNGETREVTPNYVGTIEERSNSLKDKFDGLSQLAIKEEWGVIGEPAGIPLSFYQAMRQPSAWRGDGVSVFAGLVNDVNFSYRASDGVYTLSVSAQDNTKFFEVSKINTTPSLLQSEGILEDPLTPFDLEDAVDQTSRLLTKMPELSQENRNRLPFLRFDEGPTSGDLVNEGKRLTIDQNMVDSRELMTFQHVPGLIYKWKSGIISATMNINAFRRPDGAGNSLSDLQEFYGIPVVKDPFAGLDSADIISILITGQPYNYSSFLKNSMDSGTYTTDGSNNSRVYFNFLFDFLERQRTVYGNFVPAKSAIIDPRLAQDVFDVKKDLDGQLKSFVLLKKKAAELQDTADRLESSLSDTSVSPVDVNGVRHQKNIARTSLNDINSRLETITEGMQNTKSSLPDGVKLNIAGNQTHLDIEPSEISALNRSLQYRVKRKPEEVRYNQDTNFFIVSEKYDYDVDIQAITRELKDKPASLFGNQGTDYKVPLALCKQVAETINFELFADREGNIVFRPPEYNRTPLSLLIKMLRLSTGDGSGLADGFVKNLFKSRLELVKDSIVDTDLKLSELAELGGFEASDFNMNFVLRPSRVGVFGTNAGVNGIHTETAALLDMSALDDEAGRIANTGGNTISEDSSIVTLFALADVNNAGGILVGDPGTLITIRNQLATRTGASNLSKNPHDEEDLAAAQKELDKVDSAKSANANANKIALLNDVASEISRRQSLLLTYAKLREQNREFTQFSDRDDESYRSEDLYQNLVSWSLGLGDSDDTLPQVPKFLQDLIQDDLNNNEGWRSGKRFIINDDVILSMNLSIKEPAFNRVDVQGTVDLIGGRVTSKIPEQFWAGAVDFDSWRQFGRRDGQAINRADFSNAEAQCAPYAVFKLLQERRRIHSGSIVVVGNEFYQPGDVVYVNNKSMLYYIESVQHQFDFQSAKFQTTLQLSFGHPLGEYIPTPLDIIGKGLLSNKNNAFGGIRTIRNSTPQTEHVVHLGTLFSQNYGELLPSQTFSPNSLSLAGINNTSGMLSNDDSFGADRKAFLVQNTKEIQRIVTKASSKINTLGEDSTGELEIRTYYVTQADSDLQESFGLKATKIGNWVRDALTGSNSDPNIDNNQLFKFETLSPDKVSEVIIKDISQPLTEEDKNLRRFPSAQAWSGAATSGVTASVENNSDVALPLNAIDVVFVIKRSQRGDRTSSTDPVTRGDQNC